MLVLILICVVLLGAFLVPAMMRSRVSFGLAWGCVGAIVLILWVVHTGRAATADPLAHMFDRILLRSLAYAWILALPVQLIRMLARRKGWTGYKHWPVLVLGVVSVFGMLVAGTIR